MIRRYTSRMIPTMVLLDQLVLAGSLAAALWIKTNVILPDPELPVGQHIQLFLRLWPLMALSLVLAGAYDLEVAVGRLRRLIRRTIVSTVVMAAVWIAGTFFLKMSELFTYSRAVFTLFIVISGAGLVGVRLALSELQSLLQQRQHRERRVIIFGGEHLGRKLIHKLEGQKFVAIRVVGVTGDIADSQAPRLTEEEALQRIRQEHVDHVIVDLPPKRIRLLLRVAEAAEIEGVPFQITPSIFPGIHLKPRVDRIGRIPIIELCGGDMPLSAQFAKRTFDFVLSLAGLVALSPLMVMIAVVIKLTSPGPVLYRQRRVGLDGRAFNMLKFRTMPIDAEAETGPVFAAEDDQRATVLGRLLRRTNLDELPQLLNVLAGQMSLVGPRPERPEFVQQFKPIIDRYCHKHWVKPGITGWAQVNGWRGQTDLQRRIEHDIYYIERWSIWFDLKILFLTLVRGYKNAY